MVTSVYRPITRPITACGVLAWMRPWFMLMKKPPARPIRNESTSTWVKLFDRPIRKVSAVPHIIARWKTAPLFRMSPFRITTTDEIAIPKPISANGRAASPAVRPSSSFTWACIVTITAGLIVRLATSSRPNRVARLWSASTCRTARRVSATTDRRSPTSSCAGTSRRSRKAIPTNSRIAWNQNAPSKPNWSPTVLASTGPRIIDSVIAIAFTAIALNNWSLATSAGISAERTGEPIAEADPASSVATMIQPRSIRSVPTSTAVAIMATPPANWVAISIRRRSQRSAHAPAWSTRNAAGSPSVNTTSP